MGFTVKQNYATVKKNRKRKVVVLLVMKDEVSLKLFDYAVSHGVEVRIVDNTLRRRNQLRIEGRR